MKYNKILLGSFKIAIFVTEISLAFFFNFFFFKIINKEKHKKFFSKLKNC